MPETVYAKPTKPIPSVKVPFAPAVAGEVCTPAPRSELTLDRIGIWLSGVCMVHCIATPVLLLMLPMFTLAKSEWIHVVLACVLPLITVAAFIPGYRRHGDWKIFVFGFVGLVLVAFAAFDPFKILNEITESLVTTVGGLSLISGHIRNRRLNDCAHPGHAH